MKKQFVRYFLPLIALGSFAVMAEDETTLTTMHVRGNVHMIKGGGGNVAASVGADGIVIVDSFLDGVTPKLTKALNELKPQGELKYLLNTHWHGDHTGGNKHLSHQVPVIAHDNVRTRMMSPQENFFGATEASEKSAWPVLTFNDQMTVHFNDETIALKHYPSGHTDGDAMVYFTKANVLHMGDEYFNGMYPFVDLTTGGSVLGLAKNIGKVIKQMPQDVLIIPGHGALSNLEELKAYHKMLKTSIKRVKKGMAEGLSLEQLQAAGLGEALSAYGKGFIPEKVWISFVYDSIRAAKGDKSARAHSHDNGDLHRH